jgi:hypothetical protein
MHRTSVFVPGVILLLVASILIAGCSISDTTDQTVQPETTITTPATIAKFAAGDVVNNPSSSAETAWLIIGYNPASDTYERALIYQSADGSWGYRKDSQTETTSRSVFETVYTAKIGAIVPSSVPVVTTAVITRVPVPVTTTDTSKLKPSIQRSLPDKGYAGTTVAITDLVGSNFLAGANVTLSRNDSVDIIATSVNVITPTSITCSLAIPSNAKIGTWDLTVKNPNGLSGTLANYFTINKVAVTFIDPAFAFVGPSPEITIMGLNFQPGAKVTFRSPSGKPDIVARSVIFDNQNKLRVLFDIPASSFGSYDVIVTNPDSSYGIMSGGFFIS